MSQGEILVAFEDYGLENSQKNEITYLLDLCLKSGLDAEALGDKYMQWKLNTKKIEDIITMDYLKRFEREAKLLSFKRPPKPMFIEQKKAKLIKVEGSKDFASPASTLFKDRKDKGRVIVTLNGEIEDAESDEILVELKNEKSCYKYMAQNKRDIADILHDYISDASERIEESLEITEPHPITMPIQENVTICGMIIMEGAKGSDGVFLARGEEEVKLDLDNVESFSIYPGMICAIEGNNPTGQTFVVKNISHQKFLPIQEESRVVDNTNILIACGPFFTIDSVSEEPLDELVREASEIAPHLVVLIGPFLEEKHMGTDFIQPKELSELIAAKVAEMKKVGSQVLLVPSAKDFFADPIMPTPEIDEPGLF